jgi:hypothetical protein
VNEQRSAKSGCLIVLSLWAFLCLGISLIGRAGQADERAATCAVLGILGTLLFVLALGLISVVRRIRARERREPRGFPVLPVARAGDTQEEGDAE